MARALRISGNVLVWLLAIVGAASALVWGGTRLGYVKPLVVISGSMEPGIMTGDLVVDRPYPTAELAVGDVASIRSDVTGDIITHRVAAVAALPDGTWAVNLKGDANDAQDGETYVVGDTVWQPALRVAGGGKVLVTLTRPTVAVPLALTLGALLGISLLPASDERTGRHAALPEKAVAAP